MIKSVKTIAIVLNTSWNIFNFRLGLLTALQKEGYKIVAIAPRDEYSPKLAMMGIEYHEIRINNKGTNPLEDIKLVYDFVKLYRKIKPDVLLHYTIKPNIYGTIAAEILRIPVISNISGLGTVFLNDALSSKIAKMLYKTAMRVPQKVFFQNSDDRKLFIDMKLVDRSKTDLLPGSGIDTVKFAPVQEIAPGKTVQFLFIARLVRDKGITEYVEAARILKSRYPDTEFAVLGSFYPGNPTAITEEEMRQWEAEGIIRYLGTTDDVREAIAVTHCVVLPSYREGLSRVLLEAASMAKPIVTTDTPGCRDVVEDGVNGYLCKVKNSIDLADTMEKMLNLSDTERQAMGQFGREKILLEFNENIVIQKYLDTINTIV